MLRLIGTVIKTAIFAIIVLVLGNWLRWDGKTISDQVKIGMAHAEKQNILQSVRVWAEQITHDAKQGLRRKPSQPLTSQSTEEISSSERQKLKALIRELNSSHKKD
jgi:hypothetical protein